MSNLFRDVKVACEKLSTDKEGYCAYDYRLIDVANEVGGKVITNYKSISEEVLNGCEYSVIGFISRGDEVCLLEGDV